MNMRTFTAIALLALAGSAGATDLPTTEGEIRRINAAGQEITLRHGEIKNLDMPPMTMVFKLKDPAQLGSLKAGDKVRFTADKINGAYTVISITQAP